MKSYCLSNLSILVVDDSRNMVKLLAAMLNAFNVKELLIADSGDRALEIIREEEPDLILTDWRMFPVGGEAFVKALRAKENHPHCFIPVIAVSGYSEIARVEEARAAGVNQFLVKPISPESLYRRIMWTIEQPFRYQLRDGRYVPLLEAPGDRPAADETDPRQDIRPQDGAEPLWEI